jgi:hypothetical protein
VITVKLVARVLVQRLTPAAEAVVDPGQTAFLPGRWIGYNVLQHLEEIDYCSADQQPGCVLFLDFEKAYDRMDRGWLMQCLQRMGFPAQALRWVRLMLAGTRAGVLYQWCCIMGTCPPGLRCCQVWHGAARCPPCCTSWLPSPWLPS